MKRKKKCCLCFQTALSFYVGTVGRSFFVSIAGTGRKCDLDQADFGLRVFFFSFLQISLPKQNKSYTEKFFSVLHR